MSKYEDRISREDFEAYRRVTRGKTNPERMNNPFWEAMIELRSGPYWVGEHFGFKVSLLRPDPIWCFSRMGMSRTLMPDGSTIFIGGEHEDYYDPDFCIYNDVIVRHFDGSIDIFGYPPSVFPPTDFHTATLVEARMVDKEIYIIGGLRYRSDRILGTTPVFTLDPYSKQITEIEIPGEEPGWIYKHDDMYLPDSHSIVIWGGMLIDPRGEHVENRQTWELDLYKRTWSRRDHIELGAAREPWWRL